ncbi:helix-turn-helix transcriptional regulator [Microbacterium sp.]|uniref:helix-turn-helix domain-containing protein n=1 Tax=Microbacterium sp. TaxID=51671 RepID=UPI0028A8B858|nr:helix-turn-helix transcriptional regulator [Microbacterium sp.]
MARKQARATPAMLSSGWPDQASTDPVGEAARRFVLNLKAAIGERSIREVARDAGIDEGTIRKILLGESWPDLRTIWKLESSLGLVLYSR